MPSTLPSTLPSAMTLPTDPLRRDWEDLLSSARPFELSYYARSGHKPAVWGTQVVSLQVDARPLALLVQSALLGHRVYELFSIQRPGDVLRYLWVHWAGEPSQEWDAATWFKDKENQEGKSFLSLDRRHWRPESDWLDDDALSATQAWWAHRGTRFWATLCAECLQIVIQVQACLRSSPDELIRQELALMDAGQHRRDLWPTREQIGGLNPAPSADTTLPPELFELILSLARQDDVRSVSCPVTDPALWRALAKEQLRRAQAQNLPARDALFLAGPEGGIPHVLAEDWGADVHIPYEGCCEADLFIQPKWFDIDPHAAKLGESIRAGMWGRKCRYVITHQDYGRFANDETQPVAGWFFYKPRQDTTDGEPHDDPDS